jgi:hypothetical protein
MCEIEKERNRELTEDQQEQQPSSSPPTKKEKRRRRSKQPAQPLGQYHSFCFFNLASFSFSRFLSPTYKKSFTHLQNPISSVLPSSPRRAAAHMKNQRCVCVCVCVVDIRSSCEEVDAMKDRKGEE